MNQAQHANMSMTILAMTVPFRALRCVALSVAACGLLTLGVVHPTSAQVQEGLVAPNEEGPPSQRHAAARNAGRRAINVCTQIFTAGLDEARLEADVLGPSRTPKFETVIDRKAKMVIVTYLPDVAPRIAVWRPLLGCTQLPIGASSEDARRLPRPTAAAPDLDLQRWPHGDQGALAEPRGSARHALSAVIASGFDVNSQYRGRTWGVAVVQDGKIRAERYASGYGMHTPQRTNSMCKSLAATVVGVGVRKGLVAVHRTALLQEWTRPGDPRGAITLDHLLHMASGLYSESGGNPQNYLYYAGATAAERAALNIMDSRPGTRFQYAGADTILAVRALRQAYDDDDAWLTFPHRELLWKIGMTRTTLETDWNDDFLISGDCWSTARDFARLGLLYLNDGVWNAERLLPEDWLEYVTTPSKVNPLYGAHFWLLGGRSGIPADAFAAFGAQGQYMMIVPSRHLIVVRRGFDAGGRDFDISRFTADVIKALGL